MIIKIKSLSLKSLSVHSVVDPAIFLFKKRISSNGISGSLEVVKCLTCFILNLNVILAIGHEAKSKYQSNTITALFYGKHFLGVVICYMKIPYSLIPHLCSKITQQCKRSTVNFALPLFPLSKSVPKTIRRPPLFFKLKLILSNELN